jgi:Peptidase family C78
MRLDEPQSSSSIQLILGPNLTPTRSRLLSNQTPGNRLLHLAKLMTQGLIHGLQRALQSNSSSALSVLCHPGVSHFAAEFKTFGWGCGYNNAQMLLSYIKEASADNHKKAFGEDIPSIRKLQHLIEAGWAKGCHIH